MSPNSVIHLMDFFLGTLALWVRSLRYKFGMEKLKDRLP